MAGPTDRAIQISHNQCEHEKSFIENPKRKGAQRGPLFFESAGGVSASSPPSSLRPSLPSSPLESPLSWCGLRDLPPHASGALCRLARRPGRQRVSLRRLAPAGRVITVERGRAATKKIGVPSGHPLKSCGRTTASSRPSSLRPWQPSSPLVFSPQVVRLSLRRTARPSQRVG